MKVVQEVSKPHSGRSAIAEYFHCGNTLPLVRSLNYFFLVLCLNFV